MSDVEQLSPDLSWVVLPGFRSNVPGVDCENSKPAWNLPLSHVTADGIDLDFGPLLLFDRLIVDTGSFEYATQSGLPFLAPIKRSLETLLDAGIIKLFDFSEILTEQEPLIAAAAERSIALPEQLLKWGAEIKVSYRGWLSRLDVYERALGEHFDPVSMRTEFGSYVYLMKHDGKIDPETYEHYEEMLFSLRKRRSAAQWETLQDLVRPTALYTYKNFALFNWFKAPFLDVEFTSGIYNRIYDELLVSANPEHANLRARVEAASSLFEYAVPDLRPANIEQVLRLLEKRSLHAFREFIRVSVENGVSFSDPEVGRNLYREALELEMKLGRRRNTINRAAAVLGQFPGLGIVAAAGSEIAGHKLNQSARGNHLWMFTLMESGD